MQLFSNIINNDRVLDEKKKQVITVANFKVERTSKGERAESESYNVIGEAIIKKARHEAEYIKNKALEESREFYKKAYDEGLEEGRKKGYEDAYNETVVKGNMEIENLKSLAEQNVANMIKSAKFEVQEYFNDMEAKIKSLSIEIAQHILKERIKEADGIDNMIYEALEICKKSKTIIIKCSSNHSEGIRKSLDNWKSTLPYRGDFFVVDDGYMDEGSAIIESDSGKVKVSIDDALEKIKEVLLKTE
ncbi:flagellar assembly protein FliH [Clostridium acetobutylicum]|uniref:Flagellar assembly protein FliH n=1 Tax=Clostridium acetobutylicum (strain ATCC 824 / DSM 792 / JCM 1419 / IAM 19013 / LMG 5710 / NBRC 13948 / NRRL B-527 / VKM B-1787 / 2291 / W) TaxID=272562 RepID=Q97H53_CLOAB|nr:MULTISPECIES: FliH/SctL family protein [Clostridium]AAK80118.1 Flagellar assembly protein FliH [Clostridium acetobutylicum ATCC 824]ADZ21211.1 Flagellar assembly protein FliH [Clostridium acetobutylicum EA 2018]AEI33237.1 flagellar assembly protein FliH [Clostridium acetobutylicum DSM 1731]AWV79457.1 flagellar assembly protein FliH [Clostridium acetobutylicum]MBC2394572.1 flagellar assembly protein FliH [Clostridium acetobutylicum]